MAIVKKGKKKWYQIVGPKMFKGAILGESYVYDAKTMIGKRLKVNLSKLAETKKSNADILFRIDSVKDNTAYTNILGYTMLDYYTKRILRVGTRIAEDSSVYESKDKIKMRIKFILITRGKPNNSVLSNLRKKAKEYLTAYLSKKTYDEFIWDVVDTGVQRSMRNLLKKVYPLSFCEFGKILKI